MRPLRYQAVYLLLAALCACAPPQPPLLRDAQRLEQQSQQAPGGSEGALESLLRAQRLYQASDRGAERGQAEVDLAALYLRRGELDRAQAWAQAAAAAADVPPPVRAQGQARLAQLALKRGQPEAAAQALALAGADCPECAQQGEYLVLDGRIRLARGDAAAALQSARSAQRARFGEDGGRGQADAQRLAGEAGLALHDYAAAREALDAAWQSDHAAARAERIWLDLDLLSRASEGLGRGAEAADYARRSALARAAAQPAAP